MPVGGGGQVVKELPGVTGGDIVDEDLDTGVHALLGRGGRHGT